MNLATMYLSFLIVFYLMFDMLKEVLELTFTPTMSVVVWVAIFLISAVWTWLIRKVFLIDP